MNSHYMRVTWHDHLSHNTKLQTLINRRKSNMVSVCIPRRTVTNTQIDAPSVVWGSMMISASNCTTPNSTSETNATWGWRWSWHHDFYSIYIFLIYKNTKTLSQPKVHKLYPRADGIHFWSVFKHLHGTRKREGSLELKNRFQTWSILQPIREQKIQVFWGVMSW